MPVEVIVPVVGALQIKQVSVRESPVSEWSVIVIVVITFKTISASNYFLSKKAATADHFWLLEAEPANLPSVLFAF